MNQNENSKNQSGQNKGQDKMKNPNTENTSKEDQTGSGRKQEEAPSREFNKPEVTPQNPSQKGNENRQRSNDDSSDSTSSKMSGDEEREEGEEGQEDEEGEVDEEQHGKPGH